jgi:hypothetical protein
MRSGRSWPSSRRERANVRARRRLEEAPTAPCPHCGRVTKTVDGVCADCWGVKDPARAHRWLPSPRTRRIFDVSDVGWLDPVTLLWGVGTGIVGVLVLLLLVSR